MESRSMVLVVVVAVLIATATYQVVLSPPGGIFPGDNSSPTSNATQFINSTATSVNATRNNTNSTEAGTVVMGSSGFYSFFVMNTIAFLASMTVILTILQVRPYSLLLHTSLFWLCISYGYALLVIAPRPMAGYVLMELSFCYFAVLLVARMCFWKMEIQVEKPEMYANFKKRPKMTMRLQMLRQLFTR